MNKSLFTADQIQDLRKEFVEFKLNEMTHEDMYAWIWSAVNSDLIISNAPQ